MRVSLPKPFQLSEKSFVEIMLATTKQLPGFAGNGLHRFLRDPKIVRALEMGRVPPETNEVIREVHQSYPYGAGKFFLADVLYVWERNGQIRFINAPL